MRWGIVRLHCPMCGQDFNYNQPYSKANPHPDFRHTMHHKEFGIVCGKACFDIAQNKYTRMILGKDDESIYFTQEADHAG